MLRVLTILLLMFVTLPHDASMQAQAAVTSAQQTHMLAQEQEIGQETCCCCQTDAGDSMSMNACPVVNAMLSTLAPITTSFKEQSLKLLQMQSSYAAAPIGIERPPIPVVA